MNKGIMGIISFLGRLFGRTQGSGSATLPPRPERAQSPSIQSHQIATTVQPAEPPAPVARHEISEKPKRRPKSPRSRPSVPSAWTQLPALAIGAQQQVVGEQNYQSALSKQAGGRGEEGTVKKYATACLELEPENPYDSNAVRVVIGGQTVGYLPRSETSNYLELLKVIESTGGRATCRARFTGGWDRGTDDRGSIGVTLDISRPPALWRAGETYLPADKSISLVGEAAHQEHLSDLAGSLADGVAVAELREIVGPKANRIAAFIQGGEVGSLSAASFKAYQSALEELRNVGLSATCVARVASGPKGYEVVLMLPQT